MVSEGPLLDHGALDENRWLPVATHGGKEARNQRLGAMAQQKRVAVVTGAAGGLGSAVAKLLAISNHELALCGQSIRSSYRRRSGAQGDRRESRAIDRRSEFTL